MPSHAHSLEPVDDCLFCHCHSTPFFTIADDNYLPGSPKMPKQKPAVFVGGQRRRRLVRRSTGQRSNASSSLNQQSTASLETRPEALSISTAHTALETSQSMINMQHSPLPPSTPSKAAKVLGVEPQDSGDSRRAHGQRDGGDEHLSVRQAVRKRPSLPILTRTKDVASTTDSSMAKEDGDEIESSTGSSLTDKLQKLHLWKRAKRESPSIGSGTKAPRSQYNVTDLSLAGPLTENIEVYGGDGEVQSTPKQSHHLVAPRLILQPQQRGGTRTPASKSLNTMSTINETSFSEDKTFIHDGEDSSVLEVISEYESLLPPPRSAAPLSRSITQSTFVCDLPNEEKPKSLISIEDIHMKKQEKYEKRNTQKAKLPDVSSNEQRPPILQIQSPLQSIEKHLLEVQSHAMTSIESLTKVLDEQDAERKKVDGMVAVMKAKHEREKVQFEEMKRRMAMENEEIRAIIAGHDAAIRDLFGDPKETQNEEDKHDEEDDEDDLDTIRSSIDSDEEPLVHTGEAVTFTHILPGTVKLVDIPPTKKNHPKPIAQAGPSTINMPTHHYPDYPTQHPNVTKKESFDSLQTRSPGLGDDLLETTRPDSPGPYHKRPKRKDQGVREESQLMTQDWVTSYNNTKQRPVSERIDPDVLADQQIPPAPLPKDSTEVSPHGRTPKHYCVNSGHIFHRVTLHQPEPANEGTVNALSHNTFMYALASAESEEAIRCDKCGKIVKKRAYECEIPVCGMVVCKKCARGMEQERQERAIASWKT